MTTTYSSIPTTSTLTLTPFKSSIPTSELDSLKLLTKSAPIGPATYENGLKDRRYGITREWLIEAKKEWVEKFDWREQEKKINEFPNWITQVKTGYKDETVKVHFVGLFSDKKDAVPLLLLHGWPGSFLEFLPILSLLTTKYTPTTLPYHVIVPSLVGYGFSGPPPLDRDFDLGDLATVLDNLMIGLGFGTGYVSQGGDLGSFLSRFLAAKHESCKAVHIHLCMVPPPPGFQMDSLTSEEKLQLAQTASFGQQGSAYGMEHATRPSTISFALQSNPIALLAWVGEKYLEWTDEDPPISEILSLISLYWLTNTISTTLYPYRQIFAPNSTASFDRPDLYINKPLGFSSFPKEIVTAPKSWIATTGDLVFWRKHEKGGHFAGLEVPELLLKDVEEFIEQVWKGVSQTKSKV